MVISKSRKNAPNNLYIGLGLDNIIAIPFPIYPRRVQHGQVAKILDFSAWKSCQKSEADNSTNETLEQIMKLSIAEQKIWVIRRLLEIYDYGDRKDLHKICEILYGEVPDGA